MTKKQNLVVFGYGLLFERKFGQPLENAHYSVRNALKDPMAESPALLVCFLDGKPLSLPSEKDTRLAKTGIWISDKPVPPAFDQPAVLLDEGVSSATLLLHLGRLCPCGKQRRKHERHDADFDVCYRVGDLSQNKYSQISNISLGGAFIRADDPPSVGQYVQMEIEISKNLPPLAMKGRVIYCLTKESDSPRVCNSEVPDQVFDGDSGFSVAFQTGSFETRSMLERALRTLKDANSG